MNLNWEKSWIDPIEAVNQVLHLCEKYINVLPQAQEKISADILGQLQRELSNERDLSKIRRSPHMWGTKLANVAVRIIRQLNKKNSIDTEEVKLLANFCGNVFQYRRNADSKFESDFRDSLEIFLRLSLPKLVVYIIAADVIEGIQSWLNEFYDNLPEDFEFLINNIILNAYEFKRRELDADDTRGLMMRFVEDNKDVISLKVPDESDLTINRWVKLYEDHIGEPPIIHTKNSISSEIRAKLKNAVKNNDPLAVRDVLIPLETHLIEAVRSTLDLSFNFREPIKVMRDQSKKIPADFEMARRQIRSNNKKGIESFRKLWQKQLQNLYVKEWYAYSKAKLEDAFRQSKVLFSQIIASGRGDQLTDWNLACCEVKLCDRETAYEILRKRVESKKYIDEVLEPTIALALEFKDKIFLSQHLDWLPLEEAILLGYLFAAESEPPASKEELEERLPAIEVIASDMKRFELPSPAEKLSERNLNDLCFSFMQRGMLRGGITWFRRRVTFEEHKYFPFNWKFLGDLRVQVNQFDKAKQAYEQMLYCYKSRPKISSEAKTKALEEVLNFFFDQGFAEMAESVLNKHGRELLLPAEFTRWQTRIQSLMKPIQDEPENKREKQEPQGIVKKQVQQEPLLNPQEKLILLLPRLMKLRRFDELKGDLCLLSDSADCISALWPAESRILVDQLRVLIKTLHDFHATTTLEDKELVADVIQNKMADINTLLLGFEDIKLLKLREQAEILSTVLGRLAAEASYQTSATRSIDIDWRLNEFLPDKTLLPVSPELPKTSLLIRIVNSGTDTVSDVAVHLKNESGRVIILEEALKLNSALGPGLSAVLRFPLEYDSLEGKETFLSYIEFSVGGVTNIKTPAIRFNLPIDSFSDKLKGSDLIQDAYFVGVGIPEDRRDVFHGREREQKRIAQSLRGSVQNEVLFLNGPRRVGKTSILNSLVWALPELGHNEIIPVPLPEAIPQTTQSFLWGIANEITKAVHKHLNVDSYLFTPPREEFDKEPIVVFRSFCETIQKKLEPRQILLMFDETQRLAQAVRDGRLDDNILSLFSTLMSRSTGILFIFTASVLFRNIKELSYNPIWGRVMQYATGFLSADAVERVLRAGVASYPVQYTPEAINRVWEMTEGHPWIVQAIGKRIISEVLNPQQRLTVAPSDVDQAIDFIEKKEDQYSDLWWNEKVNEGGFIDTVDWRIAEVIIKNQDGQGKGILKQLLFDKMNQLRHPITNDRINKLREMQTLVKEMRNGEEYLRIKGLFLERWLSDHDKIIKRAGVDLISDNIALFVDHENVSISMHNFMEKLPVPQQTVWETISEPNHLSRRLAQNAERFGTVTPPRYAVANWQHFTKDISAYAQAMFEISQPLGGKNGSDERIKQLIRDTLEQKPEVGIYIVAAGDADYRDTIQTLLKRNKRVIVWGFRAIATVRSNIADIYREMETWQNVTIEYLDDILLKDPNMKPYAEA